MRIYSCFLRIFTKNEHFWRCYDIFGEFLRIFLVKKIDYVRLFEQYQNMIRQKSYNLVRTKFDNSTKGFLLDRTVSNAPVDVQ